MLVVTLTRPPSLIFVVKIRNYIVSVITFFKEIEYKNIKKFDETPFLRQVDLYNISRSTLIMTIESRHATIFGAIVMFVKPITVYEKNSSHVLFENAIKSKTVINMTVTGLLSTIISFMALPVIYILFLSVYYMVAYSSNNS